MIDVITDQGAIQTIDGEHSCKAFLNNFVGKIVSISSDCTYLTLVLSGDCFIESDISLNGNQNKLDTIIIRGEGTLTVCSLKATSVEVYSDLVANFITGNVIKFSGCRITSYTERIDPPDPVDKTSLEELINAIDSGLGDYDISKYQVSEDGLDVITDQQWVTHSSLNGFNSAVAYGKSVLADDAATQEQVEFAIQRIQTAFIDLNPQWGKKVVTNKYELGQKLLQARMLLSLYSISEDGYDIPPDVLWINTEEYEYLFNQVSWAQEIYEDPTLDQITVDNAVSVLAYSSENLSPENGKQVNPEKASDELKAILYEKISESQELLQIYLPSINGEDIPRSSIWVTKYTYENLEFTVNICLEYYENENSSKVAIENLIRSASIAISSLNPQPGSKAEELLALPHQSLSSDVNLPGNLELLNLRSSPRNSSSPSSLVSDIFIKALGHVWIIDTIIEISNFDIGIVAPYILVDNSTCAITGIEQAIQSPNSINIENCVNVDYSDLSFSSFALVVDSNGTPNNFLYSLLRDESGKIVQIASRRKLYGYDVETLSFRWSNSPNALISGEQIIPAQLATPYDVFKHSTQYTNVDLHRWIDQAGEILKGLGSNYITDETINLICNALWTGNPDDWEAIPVEIVDRICEVLEPIYIYDGHPHSSDPMDVEVVDAIINSTYIWPKKNGYELDEVSSRNYEVGVYSLYSYRTTDLKFYEQDNDVSEDRELP